VVQRRVLRVVFLCALLLIPVQFVALRLLPSEPYPTLTQPSFTGRGPYSDGKFTAGDLSMTVALTDGTEVPLAVSDLLPDTNGVSAEQLLRTTFFDRATASAPSNAAWLQARVAATHPGADAVAVTFTWLDRVWAMSGPRATVSTTKTTTVTVELGRR
jgi:hypothetical protein